MSAESDTVFLSKNIKDKIVISGNENKSPIPTRSINKNLYKEGALDHRNQDDFLTSSEKKKGRRALAEITNELKAKQQQRYNVPYYFFLTPRTKGLIQNHFSGPTSKILQRRRENSKERNCIFSRLS